MLLAPRRLTGTAVAMLLAVALSILLATPGFGNVDIKSQMWGKMKIVGVKNPTHPVAAAQVSGANLLSNVQLLQVGAQSDSNAASETQQSCNAGINDACGGRKRCCEDLACSPVWEPTLSKFTAKCIVPDPDLLDETACYDTAQKCFYNYQCCSHNCIDEDGDTVFTCGPSAGNEYSDLPRSSFVETTFVQTTETVREGITKGTLSSESRKVSRTNFEAHWGTINSKIPLSAIVIFSIAAIAALTVVIVKVVRRISRNRYSALGVDKIPSPHKHLRYDTEDWEILNKPTQTNVNGVHPLESDAQAMPTLPTRDYAGGAGDAVPYSPSIPVVDY